MLCTVLMLCAAFAVLALFSLRAGGENDGFQVSGRYFIYLTPVGIIAATLCSLELLRSAGNRKWLQALIVAGIIALLLFRFDRTFALVRGVYY